MDKNKKIFGLVLLLLLSSCSLKTSYRFLDWVLIWKIDDYVDWNRAQKPEFDQRLDQFLDWHCYSQLPIYAQFLQQLKEESHQPFSEQQLLGHYETMQSFWQQMMLQASPDIAFMLSQLTDQQVDRLLLAVDKDIDEDEESELKRTAEESVQRRVKKAKSLAERFVDDINEEQLALIEQWANNKISTRDSWFMNRRHWRELLADALQHRSEDDFINSVEQLFAYPNQFWNDDYQLALKSNIQLSIDLLITLQASATPQQKERLWEELDEWTATFESLSKPKT